MLSGLNADYHPGSPDRPPTVVRPDRVSSYDLQSPRRGVTPEDSVDVATSTSHNRAEVRGPDAERRSYDLWTTCYTAPHLALLVRAAGLVLEAISGIETRAYGDEPPRITHPELLVRARKPKE
jgi:hypothetical protein